MNYWEETYITEGALWKFDPSNSAIISSKFFNKKELKNILIPGIGYGRNAIPFVNRYMNITGIEISKTAIKLAKENGFTFPIHHGSVLDMPFDKTIFDGIFNYALLHLLNKQERSQFIKSCYNQLSYNGYMIFVVVSVRANMYGNGIKLSENRFKIHNGLSCLFL